MGVRNVARSFAETTLGCYSTDYTPVSTTAWNSTDRLFTIGNGVNSLTPSDALVILKNRDTKIGSRGTFFTNVQEGLISAGTQAGNNKKTVTLNFPNAFVNASNVRVQLTPKLANGISDVFVLAVRNISTTQCTVEIYRADAPAGTGWGASFDIQWMAWE